MARYFYVEVDHLATNGCNKAVEVYIMTKDFPVLVASNYRLSSARWMGYAPEARTLISAKCGHGINNVYLDKWKSKSVQMYQLGSN